jgi:hypothetical protein
MTPLTEDMRRVIAEQKLAFVATVCPDESLIFHPRLEPLVAVGEREPRVASDLARLIMTALT